jgi:hypothetical protein
MPGSYEKLQSYMLDSTPAQWFASGLVKKGVANDEEDASKIYEQRRSIHFDTSLSLATRYYIRFWNWIIDIGALGVVGAVQLRRWEGDQPVVNGFRKRGLDRDAIAVLLSFRQIVLRNLIIRRSALCTALALEIAADLINPDTITAALVSAAAVLLALLLFLFWLIQYIGYDIYPGRKRLPVMTLRLLWDLMAQAEEYEPLYNYFNLLPGQRNLAAVLPAKDSLNHAAIRGGSLARLRRSIRACEWRLAWLLGRFAGLRLADVEHDHDWAQPAYALEHAIRDVDSDIVHKHIGDIAGIYTKNLVVSKRAGRRVKINQPNINVEPLDDMPRANRIAVLLKAFPFSYRRPASLVVIPLTVAAVGGFIANIAAILLTR